MSLLDLGNTQKRIPTSMKKRDILGIFNRFGYWWILDIFLLSTSRKTTKRCIESPICHAKHGVKLFSINSLFAKDEVFLSSAKRVVENHHVHHLRPIEVTLLKTPGFLGEFSGFSRWRNGKCLLESWIQFEFMNWSEMVRTCAPQWLFDVEGPSQIEHSEHLWVKIWNSSQLYSHY